MVTPQERRGTPQRVYAFRHAIASGPSRDRGVCVVLCERSLGSLIAFGTFTPYLIADFLNILGDVVPTAPHDVHDSA